ncbi:hypothetical protein DH2020_021400 [Rehmannia glutinosa]|uniref:Uncharacterized protein n=1 Tax=Rehmannia glutinosa TaxID=99300 RepID=A0ABR0WEK2_REHGL
MEQLGQKLLYTTLELEKLKAEANEEMQKNKEYIKQLIHLLKFAIQERDEARNQLNKLLNKPKTEYFPAIPQFQTDTNFLKPGKANSSITESNRKFLQAVLETGPLLQTLLVAGPLPRWRNPPQMQPFQIPPVSIKACDAVNVGQLDYSRTMNSQSYNSNFSNLASGLV